MDFEEISSKHKRIIKMESNWIFICGKKSYDIEAIIKVVNKAKKIQRR